jgi:very-short-patch-repair endonuclease
MDLQSAQRTVWAVARTQHDVITAEQLRALGYDRHAIHHRIERGRLHPKWRGVYAVGRPQLTREGWWMAAVLACGPHAVLSHASAAALWGIRAGEGGAIHVSLPYSLTRRRPGIVVHRRAALSSTTHHGIPTTTPEQTLIDLAATLPPDAVEAAVGEADRLVLTDPERLRRTLDSAPRTPGLGALKALLDRQTFVLTHTQLERLFLPIAKRAGLPRPRTQKWVNGGRVDFYFPELGIVVETDGLRYHRTPAQQAKDRRRDQRHAAGGLIPLRFTHWQVAREQRDVERTLAAVARNQARNSES